jgi:hypothetical protein
MEDSMKLLFNRPRLMMSAGVALGLVTAGCASGPSAPLKNWFSTTKTDPFTDARICTVETRQGLVSTLALTQLLYYPYVEKRGDDVRVGMIAGGQYKIPVGRIQLRVDNHEAWTIETGETPVDMATPSAQQQNYEATATAMANSINQAMSPYTVTTGEKARRIIEQMRTGRQLIFRTLGANQPASSMGNADLGPEFNAALAQCGI